MFLDLRNTVDNLMKEKTSMGLGDSNPSLYISFAVEEPLWQKNVLGESNPLQLLLTIGYVMGIACALRGGG